MTEIPAANLEFRTIGSYRSYAEAQEVVDRLSDEKFDVSTVKIVGEGLRSEERVTGRMTKGRAAGSGALSGLWFGLLIGILFMIFVPAAWFTILLWALILGAVWGAVFGFLAHLATGGRRDFKSVQATVAETYDVKVVAQRADEALAVLSAPRVEA
ncbi:general stress protein [Kocuria palustris]|uniref:general stress protein n=1 Tax=Kocuria palustris TaxID=71999 RepID=UPI0011A64F01|nr:general stress protein [Kocuria palustris]